MKLLLVILATLSYTYAQCQDLDVVRNYIKTGNGSLVYSSAPTKFTSSVCPSLVDKMSCCNSQTVDAMAGLSKLYAQGMQNYVTNVKNSMINFQKQQDKINEMWDKLSKSLPPGTNAQPIKDALNNFVNTMKSILDRLVSATVKCYSALLRHLKGLFCLGCFLPADRQKFVSIVANNRFALILSTQTCTDLQNGCRDLMVGIIKSFFDAFAGFFSALGRASGGSFGNLFTKFEGPCSDEKSCASKICGSFLVMQNFRVDKLYFVSEASNFGSFSFDGVKKSVETVEEVDQASDQMESVQTSPDGYCSTCNSGLPGDVEGSGSRIVMGLFSFVLALIVSFQ